MGLSRSKPPSLYKGRLCLASRAEKVRSDLHSGSLHNRIDTRPSVSTPRPIATQPDRPPTGSMSIVDVGHAQERARMPLDESPTWDRHHSGRRYGPIPFEIGCLRFLAPEGPFWLCDTTGLLSLRDWACRPRDLGVAQLLARRPSSDGEGGPWIQGLKGTNENGTTSRAWSMLGCDVHAGGIRR